MLLSILAALVGQVVLLYPQGQNVNKGIVENGIEITQGPFASSENSGFEFENPQTGNVRNVTDSARICIFLPEKRNGQMVIVCPGGGYGNLAVRHEGYQVAEWMAERGIATAVLFYRMPNGHNMVPLTDVQNAFRYCRHHSREWGVNSIGVMGFSAGGHLAASASVHFTDNVTRPDFSILIYPVISSGISIHRGTFQNLTNGEPEASEKFSLEKHVSAQTPTAFLALSTDDPIHPDNSILYYQALKKENVTAELLILPDGGHGWGFRSPDRDKLTPESRAVFSKALEAYLKNLNK